MKYVGLAKIAVTIIGSAAVFVIHKGDLNDPENGHYIATNYCIYILINEIIQWPVLYIRELIIATNEKFEKRYEVEQGKQEFKASAKDKFTAMIDGDRQRFKSTVIFATESQVEA